MCLGGKVWCSVCADCRRNATPHTSCISCSWDEAYTGPNISFKIYRFEAFQLGLINVVWYFQKILAWRRLPGPHTAQPSDATAVDVCRRRVLAETADVSHSSVSLLRPRGRRHTSASGADDAQENRF